MDHDDIIKLCQTKLKAMDWDYKEVARRGGISSETVRRFFKGGNVSFYSFQDIIYAMGLEIKII